jgi:hypothetical protein
MLCGFRQVSGARMVVCVRGRVRDRWQQTGLVEIVEQEAGERWGSMGWNGTDRGAADRGMCRRDERKGPHMVSDGQDHGRCPGGALGKAAGSRIRNRRRLAQDGQRRGFRSARAQRRSCQSCQRGKLPIGSWGGVLLRSAKAIGNRVWRCVDANSP